MLYCCCFFQAIVAFSFLKFGRYYRHPFVTVLDFWEIFLHAYVDFVEGFGFGFVVGYRNIFDSLIAEFLSFAVGHWLSFPRTTYSTASPSIIPQPPLLLHPNRLLGILIQILLRQSQLLIIQPPRLRMIAHPIREEIPRIHEYDHPAEITLLQHFFAVLVTCLGVLVRDFPV